MFLAHYRHGGLERFSRPKKVRAQGPCSSSPATLSMCSPTSLPKVKEKLFAALILRGGAGTPEPDAGLVGLVFKGREASRVGVGERGGVGVAQAEEVLVEEVLEVAVAVLVYPDVGEGAPVGVLGVADARHLQLEDASRGGRGGGADRQDLAGGRIGRLAGEGLLRVLGGLGTVAADGLWSGVIVSSGEAARAVRVGDLIDLM